MYAIRSYYVTFYTVAYNDGTEDHPAGSYSYDPDDSSAPTEGGTDTFSIALDQADGDHATIRNNFV